jgi:hypothetical protein
LPDEIIAVEYGGKNRIEYPQTVFEWVYAKIPCENRCVTLVYFIALGSK